MILTPEGIETIGVILTFSKDLITIECTILFYSLPKHDLYR
jgi:hypothetical protein